MHIYLSYGCHDNLDFAKRLASWLRLFGHDPWLDTDHDISPGTTFSYKNEAAFKKCTIILALFTPESVWPDGICQDELHYAQSKKIAIFPVLLADIARPIEFLTYNSLDVSIDPESVFTLLPSLLRHIEERAVPQKITPVVSEVRQRKAHRISLEENLKNYGSRFTGRDWLFDQLNTWAADKDSRILILSGEPGIGKSAICARLATRMEVKGLHFFNASDPDSCRPESVINAFTFQFANQFPAYREALESIGQPDTSAPPDLLFQQLVVDPLRSCEERLSTENPWIIVLDGLDVAAAISGLWMIDFLTVWLERLPPWFRVIVTTRPDHNILASFKGNGIPQITLDASSVDNQADLAEYIRTRVKDEGMDDLQDIVNHIVKLAAGNFRYAKGVLDTRDIPRFPYRLSCDQRGKFPDVLYKQYERMFRDCFPYLPKYRKEIAPFLACLAVPQYPVPETILLSAFMKNRRKVIRQYIESQKDAAPGTRPDNDQQDTLQSNPVTPKKPAPEKNLAMDRQVAIRRLSLISQFLIREGDSLHLFHPSFADWLNESPETNPFAIPRKEGFHRLAEACLQEVRKEKGELSEHVVVYTAWYLIQSDKHDKLAEILMNARYVEGAYAKDRDEFLALWALVERITPLRIKTFYAPVVEAPSRYDISFVDIVASMLQDMGHHDDAMKLLRDLESICTVRKDKVRAAGAISRQASILISQGHLNGATDLLRKAVRSQRIQKDRVGLSKSLAKQGTILHTKGDLSAAMKIYKEQEEICRQNIDGPGVLDALSSQALVLRSQGYLDKTRPIFLVQEEIRKKYWQRSEVVRFRGIQALFYLDQGEFQYAMKFLAEQEIRCHDLGDWIGVSNCLANQGFVRYAQGDTIAAARHFKDQEKICREHDNRYGLATSLGNRGFMYYKRGDLFNSMGLFMEQEEISRDLMYQKGLAISFANQALVHNKEKNFKSAFRLAGTALSIAQEEGYANLAEKIRAILEEITRTADEDK